MALGFSDIPDVVIAYVRKIFEGANDSASCALTTHPSMHEESLDHILVMQLTAAPPVFFSAERIGLSVESHWLGGRWMFNRWEITDIAFFVLLRKQGHLVIRKVALLQTKRLYSKEIAVTELDEAASNIGIGRLVETDPLVPLSSQRAFSFDGTCVYDAMRAGHPQVARIGEYMRQGDSVKSEVIGRTGARPCSWVGEGETDFRILRAKPIREKTFRGASSLLFV
jgi:hypothetical protein